MHILTVSSKHLVSTEAECKRRKQPHTLFILKIDESSAGLSLIFYTDFSACLLFVHQTHVSLGQRVIEAAENVLANSHVQLIPSTKLMCCNSV